VNARSHEEYKENIGAYMLDALPELEAELLERHLAGCESCRAEVEQLRPVPAAIARSVPQVEPPPSLKVSLMATVTAEAAARKAEAPEERRRERRSFGSWITHLQPRVAVGLALGVLAVGVVVGVAAEKIAGGGGPATTTVAAKIDRKQMPTGQASLVVKGSTGELELTGAPQPPSGRVYQLWYQHGKTIERGGTFRPRPDGSYDVDVPVAGANAVLVTVEHTGGAPAPTGPPVMQFTV
jgi:anti-sigma-K factor RskA/putative zinc finger protein